MEGFLIVAKAESFLTPINARRIRKPPFVSLNRSTVPSVYIVVLRQPVNLNDPRDDPFYEFKSFGCTGCHSTNLMHPRNGERLRGSQIAFAQGGNGEFRLVYLTPTVIEVPVIQPTGYCEAIWRGSGPARMPFRFKHAPVLIQNQGEAGLSLLWIEVDTALRWDRNGRTLSNTQRFASRFRSRCSPLDESTAAQLVQRYENARRTAIPNGGIATHYHQALPVVLNNPLTLVERQARYTNLTGR